MDLEIAPTHEVERTAVLDSHRLGLLNRISTLVLQEPDLDVVLREAVRDVCLSLDLSRCAILLLGDPGKTVEHCDPGLSSVDTGISLYWHLAHRGKDSTDLRSIIVDDTKSCPNFEGRREDLERFRVRSFIGIPLNGRQELTGILFLCRSEPHAWSEIEIMTAEAVGRGLAIVAHHARIRIQQEELIGRLFSLMNNIPGAVYRGLRDWSLTFINGDLKRITGYTSEDFLSGAVKWRDLIHPDDIEYVKGVFRETVKEKRKILRIEYRTLHRDGGIRWLEDRRQLVYTAEGNFSYVDGLLLDNTELKRKEEELRAEKEKFHALIEASPLAIVALAPDGRVGLWNAAAERMTGWREKEVLGLPLPIVPDGKKEEFHELLKRASRGESLSGVEVCRQKKDGSPFDISIWTSPIRDHQGGVVGIMSAWADVTERKRMEEALRKSEEQLLLSQRLEAIGRLAGGVAHDFNNLLTAICGYSDLLLLRLDMTSPMRAEVEEIRKAGERASSLTRQLLAFGRKQVMQPKVLELNVVVDGMDRMLRRLIGEDIDLVTVLKPGLWNVKVDPGQIEQVLMNLVVNARDAMPKGGKVTIETANVELDELYVRQHPVVKPGAYVMLAISDTGTGMDEETKNHLFEPFFTTKDKGKGTGLGLSTVYGIVKQSDGYIWVYSELEKGATFKVYLPRFGGDSDESKSGEILEPLPHGKETVLLVEDEEAVRTLVRGILEGNGYTVLEACNGEEALKAGLEHKASINLILTDVVMPKMSGREAVETLLPHLPDVKILYMSGYADEAIIRHGVLDSGLPFLQKPFTPDALLRKLRRVLDGSAEE